MDVMNVYNRLPVWVQNLACYYEGKRVVQTRYSKKFWQFLNEYENRNNWTYEQLCDYRDKKLQKMIKHCYETVPYYTKLFDEGGIQPNSIKTISDLDVLPILTKDMVKSNIDSLTSTIFSSETIKIHATGGTTGAGLNFRTSNIEEAEQWAVWWRYRRRHGISFEDWCANLGGKTIVPLSTNKPPYWRINKPGKQMFYSGYHLNEDTVDIYVESLRENNISWIHGYPSNIAVLASELNKKNIFFPVRWITTGSENLYTSQAEDIKKAFGIKPLQHYGLTEGVANISEDIHGDLTIDEDFSCIEFMPSYESDVYRIIGSSLTNWIMPLLRYDTGDLAVISNLAKHNNRGRIIDSLHGRSNEFVLLPNNVKVGAAAISLILNTFDEINISQIRQETRDRIDINVVLNIPCDLFDEKKLLRALKERLGLDLIININYVSEIERTNSGKYRLVISSLQ